jgi:hypothetical protein
MASEDEALPPSMSEAMGDSGPKSTRAEVDCGHWALWQRAAEVNEIVRRWLEEKVFEQRSRLWVRPVVTMLRHKSNRPTASVIDQWDTSRPYHNQ